VILVPFVEFYKEHHEMVTRRQTYNEAAHHLIFMAWLQRIVNSGGRVQREYATGLGRIDLCVTFGKADNIQRYAFELKIMGEKLLEDGKNQLTDYLKRLSPEEGWLILFQRNNVSVNNDAKDLWRYYYDFQHNGIRKSTGRNPYPC
jgi:hypothetical protein